MALNFYNSIIRYGDHILLTGFGKIVKVNSIDRNRGVFDYIGEDGEPHEVTENWIRNYDEEIRMDGSASS